MMEADSRKLILNTDSRRKFKNTKATASKLDQSKSATHIPQVQDEELFKGSLATVTSIFNDLSRDMEKKRVSNQKMTVYGSFSNIIENSRRNKASQKRLSHVESNVFTSLPIIIQSRKSTEMADGVYQVVAKKKMHSRRNAQ